MVKQVSRSTDLLRSSSSGAAGPRPSKKTAGKAAQLDSHYYGKVILRPSLFWEITPVTYNGSDKWEGQALNKARWAVYCGDALKVLRTLPAKSVNCAITSPPYYWLRDYGVKGQIGQEESVNKYVQGISDVMDEVYRTLTDDGLLFLNLGDTYYSGRGESHGVDRKSVKRRFGLRAVDKSGGMGIGLTKKSIIGVPWRVAIEMLRRKWVLRSPIIWHRDGCLPEPVNDRPSRSYEYLFMFAKERKYFFNKQALVDQKIEEDMWTISARPKNNSAALDTAPFPDELVQRCLDIGCPSTGAVLDPFSGSGTTLRVALLSGRPAIGIDLSWTFCNHTANLLAKL